MYFKPWIRAWGGICRFDIEDMVAIRLMPDGFIFTRYKCSVPLKSADKRDDIVILQALLTDGTYWHETTGMHDIDKKLIEVGHVLLSHERMKAFELLR